MTNDITEIKPGVELIIDGKSYGVVTEVTPPNIIRTTTPLKSKLYKGVQLLQELEIRKRE